MFLKLHEPDNKMSYLMNVDGRCNLTKDDRTALFAYQIGFAGENYFYEQLQAVEGGLKLWDITLKESSKAQFDFLIIGDGKIFHFDTKNYSGEYTYIDGIFKNNRGRVDQTIISQLKRADLILPQFLMRNGFQYEHVSRIIFVNENFVLRNFNGDQYVKFAGQIPGIIDYLKKLGPPTDEDYRLAKALISADVVDNHRFAYYDYTQMKKGYRCPKCKRFGYVEVASRKKYVACRCGRRLSKLDYITEAARQVSILKNEPFQIKEIAEWSNCEIKTVQRTLLNSCMFKGKNKGRVYWFQ
ncbi:nuclease-related domain-containing protein [Macrococcoides bohemicum]|uniref:nuclease-related domain-containing protein n=1 Tax=Macrococcoides bohemicum TaxID=1903056 RepID=UPI0028B0F3ED|nr:nuclease-related domain-containing protein [Macrococcus bohemicus]